MSPSTPVPPRRARIWHALTLIVGLIGGLLLATTMRTAKDTELRPAQPLADLVATRDRQVQQKSRTVSRLEAEIEALTDREARTNADIRKTTAAGDRLAPDAGAQAVSGPGLTVTLNDSSRDAKQPPAGFTAADMVVHQQDVQAVVNALWRGGAEAISIQDQRLVSTSAVRCVGNTLILEGRVYAPPYRITAIGDTSRLRSSLDTDRTVTIYRQYVDAVGLGYDLKDHDTITMPAFVGPVKPRRANAVG